MADLARIRDDLRRSLRDVDALVRALGLTPARSKQRAGVHVLCPVHKEHSPSCSVTTASDGGIRVHCFGCPFTGDALSLIAQVRGLGTRGRDWVAVLREAALIAGAHSVVAELDAPRSEGKRPRRAPTPPAELPPPVVNYPPAAEVRALWDGAERAEYDAEALAYLAGRGLGDSPYLRVLRPGQALPDWARFRGQHPVSRSWLETGHRLIVPVFDCDGTWRSVRAIAVAGAPNVPKRLPPAGHSAAGLVLANRAAVLMLRGGDAGDLVLVEGEPDWLTWAERTDVALIGVFNGSWHPGFGKRVPDGCRVVNRIQRNEAGARYAADIAATLPRTCRLLGVAG